MPKDVEVVDQIEETRKKNNVEWMTILRIALEADPVRTKAVLGRIERYDREIHGLLRQIAES